MSGLIGRWHTCCVQGSAGDHQADTWVVGAVTFHVPDLLFHNVLTYMYRVLQNPCNTGLIHRAQ